MRWRDSGVFRGCPVPVGTQRRRQLAGAARNGLGHGVVSYGRGGMPGAVVDRRFGHAPVTAIKIVGISRFAIAGRMRGMGSSSGSGKEAHCESVRIVVVSWRGTVEGLGVVVVMFDALGWDKRRLMIVMLIGGIAVAVVEAVEFVQLVEPPELLLWVLGIGRVVGAVVEAIEGVKVVGVVRMVEERAGARNSLVSETTMVHGGVGFFVAGPITLWQLRAG